MPPDYEYWAFLSYSSKDRQFAQWLHRGIERYAIPAPIVSQPIPLGHPAPKRFRPIFRDRDDARATADLASELTGALRSSAYLIVVCSAHAATSEWVNREIETYCQLGRGDRVLAIIVDGYPEGGSLSDCFPPALRACEPLAADARPSGDGRRNAKLKLLAGMLGISFDALRRRDAELNRRRRLLAATIAFVVMAIFGALFYRAHLARVAERLVLEQQYRRTYTEDMQRVRTLWDRDDFEQIRRILAMYEQPAHGDPRGPEWNFWKRLAKTDAATSFSIPDAKWSTIAFDAGGQHVALVDKHGNASIRDRATGREPFHLPTSDAIWRILFTPDGKYGAALSPKSAGFVQLWDPKDGHALGQVRTPFASSIALPVSAQTSFETSSKMLWGTSDGAIYLQELPSGRVLLDLAQQYTARTAMSSKGERYREYPSLEVSDIDWSADGEFFATGYADGSAVIWDSRTHRIISRLRPEEGTRVTGVAFSPDDVLLAVQSFSLDLNVSDKGDIRVCDTGTGEIVSRWQPHASQHFVSGSRSPTKHLWFPGQLRPAFTADSARLLTTGETSVQVWDAKSGRWLYDTNRAADPVTALTLNSDRTMVASIDADTVRVGIVERSAAERVCRIDTPVSALVLNPNKTLLAAKCGGGELLTSLRVWSATDGHEIPLEKREGALRYRSIHPEGDPWFSPDGQEVGWGLEHFSLANGKRLSPLSAGAKDEYHQRVFTNDGNLLLLVPTPTAPKGQSPPAEIVDLKAGRRVTLPGSPPGSFDALAISADNRLAAAAGADGTIRLWSTKDGAALPPIAVGSDITALAFSPDGSRIASGGLERIVNVWKVATGEKLATLAGHRREISALAFSPDGRRLVSSSGRIGRSNIEPGEVRLWDLSTGELCVEFPAERLQIYGGVAFSADGQRIYASTSNSQPPNDASFVKLRLQRMDLSPPAVPFPLLGGIVCWNCTAPP